jgi:adenosylhomocysteine nucleosidase
MKRVAIIAAMPGELKFLVRGWRHTRSNGVDLWRSDFLNAEGNQGEWIAACAGAGVDAAARAFAEVEKDGAVSLVISTGWAGALSKEFAPGHAFDVSSVIDARTGERFAADLTDRFPSSQNRDLGHPAAAASHPSRKNNDAARVGHPDSFQVGHPHPDSFQAVPPDCWLVTGSRVADAAEKQRLASTYQAALVDMEAAGLARLAFMRGIPFYCVKGVSDGYSDKLPDFNLFISTDGEFRLARFVVFALFRPWRWPALMRMGENSTRAARAMAALLFDLLNQRFSG